MTLKIYLDNGESEFIDVENKEAALKLIKKHNLKKSEVILLDKNLEEIHIS